MKYFFSIFLGCFLLFTNVTAQALTDGEYLIKVNQTGKYLAISGANRDNGAWLIQWDNEYTSHFRFILKHLGNNVYTLQAKHSGKYLSVEGIPKRGAKVLQWDWMDQDNQKWIIIKRNGASGYSISSFQNNMRVTMQHWGASTTQPGNGAYTFITDDISVSLPVFDFKKNETDQIQETKIKKVKKVR
jgi:Ricin-type beta-trefoil lectin domain-like